MISSAPDTFPTSDSLCESCGYPLRGLRMPQPCPECGLPLAQSDPRRRIGLPWQQRITLANWFKTSWIMTRRPAAGWSVMRFDPPRPAWQAAPTERIYILSIALGVGALWAISWRLVGMPSPWRWGAAVTLSILFFSYVEIAGVVFYSRRRGWRTYWSLIERLVCYLTIWWLPAAILFFPLCVAQQLRLPEIYWPTGLGRWDLAKEMLLMITGWGLCIMAFEWLVWLGVRRLRFANWSPPGIPLPADAARTSEIRPFAAATKPPSANRGPGDRLISGSDPGIFP